MLQDVAELLVVEASSRVGGGTLEHDVNLLLGEAVTKSGEHLTKLLGINETSEALVKGLEGLEDLMLRVGAAELLAHQGQEHGEVDGTWGLADHVLNVVIVGGLACKHKQTRHMLTSFHKEEPR